MISPPVACPEKDLDTVKGSQNTPVFKRWLQTRLKKINKDTASHKPDQLPEESRRPADLRSRSHSPVRANAAIPGPSMMAAGQRVRVNAIL